MTQINEGFWDAIVNGVKRGALAVGAAAGSGKADGKLTALNLATKLYDEFNKFAGSTGLKGSPDTMKEYMVKKLGFSEDFSNKAGVEFERFLKSPSTYPNSAADGSSPMGDKPKNYNDAELRKYFLKVAQTALRTGEARDAASAEIKQNHSASGEQPKNDDAGKAPPENTTDQDAAATQPEQTATSQPASVDLKGINLDDSQKKLLNQLEHGAGSTEGVAGFVKAEDPQVQALARKIITQALRDYRLHTPMPSDNTKARTK